MAEVIDILSLVPQTLNLRSKHLWLDYDEDADVLYISLRKPQRATDSDMDGRFVYHYDGTSWWESPSSRPKRAREHRRNRLAAIWWQSRRAAGELRIFPLPHANPSKSAVAAEAFMNHAG